MSDTKWFIKEIKLIHVAYDLRGFLNGHREQVLGDSKTYYALMRQANKLLNASVDSLDRTTIENFLFDYECEKEQYDIAKKIKAEKEAKRIQMQEERDRLRSLAKSPTTYETSNFVEPEFPNEEMTKALRQLNERLPPSKSVKIEILDSECDNLHDEVRKEIFRVVMLRCKSKTQVAKRLGLSIRTVRNFLDEITKDTHEHTP